jgi:hypothetical protein
MHSISDKELIKNHTVFFAYFCHLIETDQVEAAEELCEIGWKLDEEIRKKKITNTQIEDSIKNTILNPEDQIMVDKYIFPNSDKMD